MTFKIFIRANNGWRVFGFEHHTYEDARGVAEREIVGTTFLIIPSRN